MNIKRIFSLFLVCYFFLNCWLAFQKPFAGFYNDDGLYLVLAKSLSSGHGYREIDTPDQRIHVTVPFLYPLILSAFFHLSDFPDNVLFIKILNIIFAVITLYFLFNYYLIFMSEGYAFLCILCFSFNYYYIIHVQCVMTEILFILFSVCHFFAFRKQLYLLSSLFLILAFYTRSFGIVLVFTSLLYMPFLNSLITLFFTGIYFINIYFVKYLTLLDSSTGYITKDFIDLVFNISLLNDLSSLFLIPCFLGVLLFFIFVSPFIYFLYLKIKPEYEFTYIFICLIFFLITPYGAVGGIPRYLSVISFIFILSLFKSFIFLQKNITFKFETLFQWLFVSFIILHINISVRHVLSDSYLHFDRVLFDSYFSSSLKCNLLSGDFVIANPYHRLFYLLSGIHGSENISDCDYLLYVHRLIIYRSQLPASDYPDNLFFPFPKDYQIIDQNSQYTIYKLNKIKFDLNDWKQSPFKPMSIDY